MTSSSLGLSCRIHSKGKSDDHYSQRRYDKPGKVPGLRALMPRSLSSKRNWTAEGSPAASGQVSGQGRGQAAPRLTSDDSIRTYVPFWPETCVSTPHICHILYLGGGLKPAAFLLF